MDVVTTLPTVRPFCDWCGKRLSPIRDRRKNGGMKKDWDERAFHLKCWKTMPQPMRAKHIAEERARQVTMPSVRIYFQCKYVQRLEAKSLGARWDAQCRCWYAPSEDSAERLSRAGFRRLSSRPQTLTEEMNAVDAYVQKALAAKASVHNASTATPEAVVQQPSNAASSDQSASALDTSDSDEEDAASASDDWSKCE